MAKISVNLDTDSKVMSVTIDGKDIPNVDYVSIYSCCDDEKEVSICTKRMKDDSGIVSYTSYTARAGKPLLEENKNCSQILNDYFTKLLKD